MVKNFFQTHGTRILSSGVLLLSILFLPWWVSLFLSTVFLFRFSHYYELFLFAFIADSLFGKPLSIVGDINIGFFISAFALFTLTSFLKRYVSFSHRM